MFVTFLLALSLSESVGTVQLVSNPKIGNWKTFVLINESIGFTSNKIRPIWTNSFKMIPYSRQTIYHNLTSSKETPSRVAINKTVSINNLKSALERSVKDVKKLPAIVDEVFKRIEAFKAPITVNYFYSIHIIHTSICILYTVCALCYALIVITLLPKVTLVKSFLSLKTKNYHFHATYTN